MKKKIRPRTYAIWKNDTNIVIYRKWNVKILQVSQRFGFFHHCLQAIEYFEWVGNDLIGWQNESVTTCGMRKKNKMHFNKNRHSKYSILILIPNANFSTIAAVTKFKCVREWNILHTIHPINATPRCQIYWINEKKKKRRCYSETKTWIGAKVRFNSQMASAILPTL